MRNKEETLEEVTQSWGKELKYYLKAVTELWTARFRKLIDSGIATLLSSIFLLFATGWLSYWFFLNLKTHGWSPERATLLLVLSFAFLAVLSQFRSFVRLADGIRKKTPQLESSEIQDLVIDADIAERRLMNSSYDLAQSAKRVVNPKAFIRRRLFQIALSSLAIGFLLGAHRAKSSTERSA